MPTALSRRGLLGAAGLWAISLPLATWAEEKGKRLSVVVAGGHPDDPETGAGGTMARYSRLNHNVVCLYLTRGEAGISGKSHEESARIRTAEAENACRILGARPIFAGQIDGATEVNPVRYDQFQNLLERFQPDIVFTHFPVDTHRDHRAVSLLVFDSWQRARRKFLLYYFEVLTGEQTQNFQPTEYVDITATEPFKHKACLAHESQGPVEMYSYHEKMSRFRGMECGVEHAEAFVSYALNGRAGAMLDGL
jgi:N-acetylglucosamine malate deacetylase 1